MTGDTTLAKRLIEALDPAKQDRVVELFADLDRRMKSLGKDLSTMLLADRDLLDEERWELDALILEGLGMRFQDFMLALIEERDAPMSAGGLDDFDATVAGLGGLVGERVNVSVLMRWPRAILVELRGVLRPCPAEMVAQIHGEADVAGFYVDGGQEMGCEPMVFVHREHFVPIGLPELQVSTGIAWAYGATATLVMAEAK